MMPPKTPVSIDGMPMIGRGLDAAQLRADAHRGEEDDVADRAGERGDAVVFRQPDGDADGEEQRQIAEDRVARRGHDLRDALGQPREVRAADAEQDAGDRQHRDRQHHALADLLEEREGVLEVTAWLQVSRRSFGIGNERAHVLRGFRGERALGELAALVEAQRADLRLYRGDRGQADAQFVHADAEEDRHGRGIAGDAAAHAHASTGARARRRRCAR